MTPAKTAPAATLDAAPKSLKARIILDAAAILLSSLAKGEALDARLLRAAMEQVSGASDQMAPGAGRTPMRLPKLPAFCFSGATAGRFLRRPW